MIRFTTFFISSAVCLLLAGCNAAGSGSQPDDILLRIENVSSSLFSSVLVKFPGAEGSYGSIKPGGFSRYREFEIAYRYGYIEVASGGERYRLQPIDYVGEQPLEQGRYTYRLHIEEDYLSLEFRRD